MKNVYIYTLSDPDTLSIKYVGVTIHPKKRYRQHLIDKGNTKKSNWVKSLKKLNKLPIMDIIEISDEENWEEKERYYISYFRSAGYDIKNLTEGGGGSFGYKFSDEVKKNFSINRRGELNSFYNRKHSKDVKEILSYFASQRVGEKNPMWGKNQKESSKKLMSLKKIGKYIGSKNPRARKLYQYDVDNNLVREWDYAKECADYYKISRGNISNFAKHNTKVDIDGLGKYRILNSFIFKFH